MAAVKDAVTQTTGVLIARPFTKPQVGSRWVVWAGGSDYAAITEQPAGYLVAARGDGTGGAAVVTKSNSTDDNRGYFFGAKGLGVGTEQRAIRVTDADRDGHFDEVHWRVACKVCSITGSAWTYPADNL